MTVKATCKEGERVPLSWAWVTRSASVLMAIGAALGGLGGYRLAVGEGAASSGPAAHVADSDKWNALVRDVDDLKTSRAVTNQRLENFGEMLTEVRGDVKTLLGRH